jgi:hypothetical protein
MKNSFLKTKVALVSLVLLTGAAQAESYDKILEKLIKGRTTTPTELSGPHSVSGNFYVNGSIYGKYEADGAHASLTAGTIAAADIRTTGDVTVASDLTVGTKRMVGQINSFDPAKDMLKFKFTGSSVASGPAFINWTFVTTTTWTGGTTAGRSESVAVVATNGEFPDIVSPYNSSRSFVGTDHAVTNTTYMWTGKQAGGINYGLAPVRSHNNPRTSAYYSATNQDLTLTSSVRRVTQNSVASTPTYVAGEICWGLTSALSNFHTGVHNATTGALTTNTNSPFNAGTLYYEIVSNNLSSVGVTTTWDRPLTLTQVLATFTDAELQLLLDSVLAELASFSLRKPGICDNNKRLTRKELIKAIERHKNLLANKSLLTDAKSF